MRKRSTSKLISHLFGVAVVTAALPALADSYQVYPATNCTVISGTVQFGNDGALYNASSSTALILSCPVDRPVYNGYAGEAWVEYIDDSSSAVSCTWRAEDDLAGSFHAQTVSSSFNDSFYRELYFSGVADYDHGAVHFVCTLPANSSGFSYLVQYKVGWHW